MARAEREFLPAALEIQQTPPVPAVRWLGGSLIALFVMAVAWASVGQVDIVVVAQGRIMPPGRTKVIQPLEPGVVREIFVQEGGHVRAGQPLLKLDSTGTGADRDRIAIQEQTLFQERARLRSILAGVEADQMPGSSGQSQPLSRASASAATESPLQQDRIRIRLNEFRARTGAIEDELRQRQSERDAVSGRIRQLHATLPLVTERAQSHRRLADRNLVPRVQWLELEQERIELNSRLDVEGNNLAALAAIMSGIGRRQAALQAEFAGDLLAELADVEGRIAVYRHERIKAEQRVLLQTLTAPVTGTVQRLAIHSIGGVVTPAQELMQIVPDGEPVEIEAWVQNKDIGFVHPGQPARIKVETFPFTRYGTVAGEVTGVSRDATPDERLGPGYAARVRIGRAALRSGEYRASLAPGMAVTVEIGLGTRRLIEFLLSPLLRYREESARER